MTLGTLDADWRGLKIRVSVVRFRPWPPFPSGTYVDRGVAGLNGWLGSLLVSSRKMPPLWLPFHREITRPISNAWLVFRKEIPPESGVRKGLNSTAPGTTFTGTLATCVYFFHRFQTVYRVGVFCFCG